MINILDPGRKKFIKQALRFGVSGSSAAGLDWGVYFLLFPIAGIDISKAVSYVLATICTFVLNKFWTFGARKYSKAEIARFVCLYSLSMCLNNIVNQGVYLLSDRNKLAGVISATAVCSVMNFFGLKFFVFRRRVSI
ncbi:MAG: GtrA family protein [Brevinematales bacterium]